MNRLLRLCLPLVALAVCAGGARADTSLLVHWELDETSGTTASDSSANSNSGALSGNPVWRSSGGEINGALEFDGSGDEIEDSDAENYLNGLTAVTVSVWVKSDVTNVDKGIFVTTDPSGSDSVLGMRYDKDGSTGGQEEVIKFALKTTSGDKNYESSAMVQTTDWQHLALTWSSGGTPKLYINGMLDVLSDDEGSLGGSIKSVTKLLVGIGGKGNNWDGKLDDFRVYNRQLSSTEIAELYGLLAHWKLDETSGLTAVDSGVMGNDATYVGAPTLGAGGVNSAETNTSVLLDGTSESINSNTSLLNDVEGFTLIAWFNPTSLSPVKSFFGQNGLIEVGIDTTTNQIELWTSQGGAISVSSAMVSGSWKHIAAVGNGTTLTLYLNGQAVATGGSAIASYGSNTGVFKIGEGVMDSSGGYYSGRIDDARIYNRPLCPEEVQAFYDSSRTPGVRIISWTEVR